MIRVHFTAADVGRVTFPVEPHPLWEAALAARALGEQSVAPGVRRWRRTAAPRVQGSMRPLFKLISPGGLFPDFLTPSVSGLEPAVEALMETPADVIRDELEPWLPPEIDRYMRGLLEGRAGSRRALGNAVRDFHEQVLVPSSAELQRRYGADLGIRSQTLLHGGIDALLSSLHPDVEWSSPVLTTYSPVENWTADIHLNGRGLELYPSPLVTNCLAMDAPDRRPVLVYPCTDLDADTEPTATDALADLLGRTRAAVLRSLTHPATTTQLARRLGISLASTSDHTRILRAAGLITTHRAQGTALHALTPTARPLLTREEAQWTNLRRV
ncbi:winged helix-turn-helix domain-containing protein [Kribbella jejuensis]|uniref:Helix-turn-helix protein n=1 Tax=Kribbella jejuensis TaxID=236068 RepID=A0A542EVT0_9ACTN|nr:winged helix-turn-helix domain-containing protein [Kribbella jejuensis]TQJ19468.1 helix-turn-helix protein [Kribbella jejuensis]